MTTYRPSQTLHPLSLLAQISSRRSTGCLMVSTASTTWRLYLDRGRLNYATTTAQAFDRLDAHLRKLNSQVPTLVSGVRVQVRLLFEKGETGRPDACPDYQAICWLVEQQHLHPNQATTLIESMSKEVVEAFLQVREGSYELLEADVLHTWPKFCQLSLRPLVEECYERLKQRQNGGRAAQQSAAFLQQNGSVASPQASEASVAVSQPSQSGLPLKKVPPDGKTTYTIACIDDSPTVLRAIHDFLDDKIFSVIMISDPVKALMQIIRNKPDLILLDVTMPNLDGYELCSLLRRHPDFKTIPIIMVTSNTGFIDRAKAKLVRASGYLTKPFNQSDLLKIIFKHLN